MWGEGTPKSRSSLSHRGGIFQEIRGAEGSNKSASRYVKRIDDFMFSNCVLMTVAAYNPYNEMAFADV